MCATNTHKRTRNTYTKRVTNVSDNGKVFYIKVRDGQSLPRTLFNAFAKLGFTLVEVKGDGEA